MRRVLFQIVVSAALFAGVSGRGATTRELLSSTSQAARNLGARILLESFVPPPRTNWDTLMGRLKPGLKESAVAELLSSVGATNVPDQSSVNASNKIYRLDDLWLLRCDFTNAVPEKSEGGLSGTSLIEQMDSIVVEPPPGFTGEWITYWVNGGIHFHSYYVNGELDGTNTIYYPDGSLCDEAFCREGVLDGDATAYYPTGKIQSKGQYRAGAQVGRWIWYNENGKVEAEKNFKK